MYALRGLLTVLARLMIAAIFLMSAAGNKIPRFAAVVEDMKAEGVPRAEVLLVGAIAVLLLGGLSVALGYKGRLGALLLLGFLGAATYYFHDFWKLPQETPEQQKAFGMEMGQFLKNVALMGTMVFILANGTGPWSLDNRRRGAADEAPTA